MTKKLLILATGAAGLLAATIMPASAQVQDFFCNTFTIGCPDAPPPAPIPVQATEPAPPPVKAKHHVKKKKPVKAKEAKADSADKADATESK